jgi:hypothetical protein
MMLIWYPFNLSGPPKSLDEDETEFLDKLEEVFFLHLQKLHCKLFLSSLKSMSGNVS